MLRIGLTGGLASGKTTVAGLLRELGASVFDADEIVRNLYGAGGDGARAARDVFGEEALQPDGSVDRVRVAALVFSDPGRRRRLEERVHPLVRAELQKKFHEAEASGADVAVAEASQILEAGTQGNYDRILLVTAPMEERVSRWKAKGGDPEDARGRMAAQILPDEAARHAHDAIVNDGTLAELARKVEALYRTWTR
ncbi:MAG: dephospho-CoA kinase [Thermoanaerobaculia bacterium]